MSCSFYGSFWSPVLYDYECIPAEYVEARNAIRQYSNTSDGYSVLYQMVRLVHPHLVKGAVLYNCPQLSQSSGDIYKYADMFRNFLLVQDIKHRTYSEKEQSEMFLQNIDDPSFAKSRAQCLSELDIATMDGSTNVKISDLKIENLPTTVTQYRAKLEGSTGVIRAMRGNNRDYSNNRRNNNPPRRYKSPSYEPYQCLGCGGWGHRLAKCQMVPKVALCIEYIKNKPKHAEKLVSEFKRVNNKATKTGTVRAMLATGMLDGYDDPATYLADQDIEISMEDVSDAEE